MKTAAKLSLIFVVVVGAFLIGTTPRGDQGFSFSMGNEVAASENSEEVSPVKARAREAYYPNSEDLLPDEMRVIACGTGMPTTRAAQAAACFLVELGNGDKFH